MKQGQSLRVLESSIGDRGDLGTVLAKVMLVQGVISRKTSAIDMLVREF